jgi:uncharacterized protein (TIGR00304 family)
MTNLPLLQSIGVGLIFAGVLVIIIAFILLAILSLKRGKIQGGGVIMIGPVPIIFGTDKNSLKTVLLLSLVLTVLLVITIIFYYLLLG